MRTLQIFLNPSSSPLVFRILQQKQKKLSQVFFAFLDSHSCYFHRLFRVSLFIVIHQDFIRFLFFFQMPLKVFRTFILITKFPVESCGICS